MAVLALSGRGRNRSSSSQETGFFFLVTGRIKIGDRTQRSYPTIEADSYLVESLRLHSGITCKIGQEVNIHTKQKSILVAALECRRARAWMQMDEGGDLSTQLKVRARPEESDQGH